MLNLPKPKQKLNERQQELWDEWLFKDGEISSELDRLIPGQLQNDLVQKQKKLQQHYFKMIKEAIDEHS